MSSITPAVRLAEADRALRQVLATLDERPGSQQAPADVQALTAAPPADYATLVQQVRRVLAGLHQRYGTGPLTPTSTARPA